MTTKPSNAIRCKFCKWTTRKWEGKGKGGPTKAFIRLKYHLVDEHYDDDPELTAFLCDDTDQETIQTLH